MSDDVEDLEHVEYPPLTEPQLARFLALMLDESMMRPDAVIAHLPRSEE